MENDSRNSVTWNGDYRVRWIADKNTVDNTVFSMNLNYSMGYPELTGWMLPESYFLSKVVDDAYLPEAVKYAKENPTPVNAYLAVIGGTESAVYFSFGPYSNDHTFSLDVEFGGEQHRCILYMSPTDNTMVFDTDHNSMLGVFTVDSVKVTGREPVLYKEKISLTMTGERK